MDTSCFYCKPNQNNLILFCIVKKVKAYDLFSYLDLKN